MRTSKVKTEEGIEKVLQESVGDGQVAGAAVLVRRGGETQFAAAGWRDIEARLPMKRDTLFRIASMTKPITSVAALMLVDEGRIVRDEPIARVAPEFAKMRVLRRPDGPLNETVEAERQITFDDLLTHRSGLTYGDPHRSPLSAAYRERLGGDFDSDVEPNEWIRRLAELPLVGQPGSAMYFGGGGGSHFGGGGGGHFGGGGGHFGGGGHSGGGGSHGGGGHHR